MQGLSPALQQLVDAGKTEAHPTYADCERVLNGIRARLALADGVSGPAPGATESGNGSGISALRLAAKASVGAALIVAGVALLQWLAPRPLNFNETLLVIPAGSASAVTEFRASPETRQQNDVVEATAVGLKKESQTAPTAASAGLRGSRRVRDSLSAEVEILSRAETELHGGRPERALLLLNEHEHKFKNGTLVEERIAASVQALCALGRVTEANSFSSQLSPLSLHGKTRRQACVTLVTSAPGR